LATQTASAKIGAAETNYNREQTILGNVNQAVASGTLVDTETAKNYQEITGNSYLDEMKKVNPEAYAVYDYRNKVQTATESETMSANAKSIVDTYATGNPYTTGNSLYATHSVLDSYVDGNITSTDIKDMAEIYGINNITSGIKELENSLILGMETEDTEATPGYQERNTKAYNKIFGESGTMEKLAKDLGIEIDWEEPVETQVEPTAYTVSKGTVGKAGAKYTINETEYNVNWTKNKNDKKSMEVAELDKITTPVDNNIYQGADKRYYIYTSKGWNQLELD